MVLISLIICRSGYEVTRYQKLLQLDLLKIADSMNHELRKQSTSDTSLKQRTTHIAKLNNKLEEISKMQSLLADFAREEKRPVGRPKKSAPDEKEPERQAPEGSSIGG